MPMTEFHAPGRKFFGAGDEVSGGVVDENVERGFLPDGIDHRFDGVEVANVAGDGVDCAVRFAGRVRRRFLENIFAAAADVDGGSEFEEACGHAFAEAGAAAGDEDALVLEKIGFEHRELSLGYLGNERRAGFLTGLCPIRND
jgi:hypothetical protein